MDKNSSGNKYAGNNPPKSKKNQFREQTRKPIEKNKPRLTEAEIQKNKWARLSVVSNSFLLVFKIVVGIAIFSISVISEGLHTGIDLIAAIIAAYSVNKAIQPADREHKFGHGKYENVSGTIEAILIFFISLVIIAESGVRIYDWSMHGVVRISVDIGIITMFFSTIVNFFVSRKLHKVAKKYDSIAIEADAYHLSADVWTSFGVFIGLLLIRVGQIAKIVNIEYIDPIIAIIVGLIILKTAISLTKRSMHGLLDGSLPEKEEKIILKTIEEHYNKYIEFHELRSRKAGPERHIDLHLVVSKGISVERAHALCDTLESEIEKKLTHTRVIIHIEPCEEHCSNCKFEKKSNGECLEKAK